MCKFWRTFVGSILALSLWGGMVLLLTSCATLVPITVTYTQLPWQYAGRTGCDTLTNLPFIEMQPWTKEAPQHGEVLFHEVVHASQMINHPGGCTPWITKYMNDPLFRLVSEAEAYCRSMAAHRKGEALTEGRKEINAYLLKHYSDAGKNEAQINTIVETFCPEATNASNPVRLSERRRLSS